MLCLLLKHWPELTLIIQCICWIFAYDLTKETSLVWFNFCLSSLAQCLYPTLPWSTFTSEEISEACQSSHPSACGIRVTFSPHCGIVGPLPGRDEEEQAESADRWRGDPRWDCTTAGSPARLLGPACCWGYSWWRSWACDGGWGGSCGWSWWTSGWSMTGGLGGGIDTVMQRSGPPDVPDESLFTWNTTNKREVCVC